MRGVLVVLLLVQASPIAVAQGQPAPAERDAVVKTVQAFFDTMAAKDVEGARRIMMPQALFNGVGERDGKPTLRTFTNEEYLKDLAGMKQALRERMWNPEVRIRGAIASVWTPYRLLDRRQVQPLRHRQVRPGEDGGRVEARGRQLHDGGQVRPKPVGAAEAVDQQETRDQISCLIPLRSNIVNAVRDASHAASTRAWRR